MKKKTILTDNDISNIIKMYQEDTIGVEALAGKFNVGKLKIKAILTQHNIPIKKKGAQVTTGDSSEIEISHVFRYTVTDNSKKLIAVCKSTNKEFDDVNNVSGALTSHILSTYGDVPVPTNTYQRKKYEKQYGKKWFEEYFDIKEVDKPDTRKCRVCDWETVDVNNLTGCFEQHLSDIHNLSLLEYLEDYPEDIKYHSKYAKLKHRSNPNNHVTCMVCNKKMGYITAKHLLTHNMTLSEYKLKYPKSKVLSNEYKDNLKVRYEETLRHFEPVYSTKPQEEIYKFIKSFGVSVKKNDKSLLGGVEIDILTPDKRIGLEYNGLYYHREGMGKDRNYHLNKTKLMNDSGYGLIHIFEDEWLNNKELVLNKIAHLIGVNCAKSVGGRQCEIKQIDSDIKSDFLSMNHIQGADKSEIAYGAYHGGVLVAVMCFTNKRSMNGSFTNDGEYELSRYATDNGYRVVGVAGKLIKRFINDYNPKNIISFGDRRWVMDGDNNMYTKLGFKLVKVYAPDYKYYNPKIARNKRLHKFGFGKSSLREKHPELDFSKTERELMLELGYDRIWDCGLFKYELVCKP
jgi:very-short-patch-repair endonuclease